MGTPLKSWASKDHKSTLTHFAADQSRGQWDSTKLRSTRFTVGYANGVSHSTGNSGEGGNASQPQAGTPVIEK